MDLVLLHGPAAAGKLTVARAVSGLVGYPVFHNHLVVDLLTTVFPFGSAPFVALRERFWLEVVAAAVADDRSLLFTFAPEPTVTSGFPAQLRETVESGGGRFRAVSLVVGVAEQERRLGEPSRREFHKLTDVEVLRRHRGQPVETPPADLVLDTERLTPTAAAAAIVEAFDLTAEPPAPRYPD